MKLSFMYSPSLVFLGLSVRIKQKTSGGREYLLGTNFNDDILYIVRKYILL